MNIPPSISPQTLDAAAPDLAKLMNRFEVFEELWSSLAEKPIGPALIYQVPIASDEKSMSPEVRSLPLDNDLIVVGRLPRSADPGNGSDLAFPDHEKLSKRHFCIKRTDDGFILEDIQSKNGTFVNTAAKRTSRKELVGGDLIYAGGIVFAFTGD